MRSVCLMGWPHAANDGFSHRLSGCRSLKSHPGVTSRSRWNRLSRGDACLHVLVFCLSGRREMLGSEALRLLTGMWWSLR